MLKNSIESRSMFLCLKWLVSGLVVKVLRVRLVSVVLRIGLSCVGFSC